MNSLVTLVARILLSLIFLLSGLSKLGDISSTVVFMESRGVPFSSVLVYAAAIVEITGALFLITGYRAKTGALLLSLYLIPVTYLFHYKIVFSPLTTASEQKVQMMYMVKNISIIGGLLLAYCNGVGNWKIGRE